MIYTPTKDMPSAVTLAGQLTPALDCMICRDSADKFSSLACGHSFCDSCYSRYLTYKIRDDGDACTFITCPHPQCNVVINSQLVKTLLPDDSEELRQYHAASKDQVATEVAVDLGTEPWMAVGVPSPALNPYAISGLDMDDDWEAQAINTLACNMSHSGYNSENDYY